MKKAIINFISTFYDDWDEPISPIWFEKELKNNSSADEFEFLVSSDGGSMRAGLAINEMIKSIDKPTTTRISFAASTAGWALMSSDKIIMPKNALLMLHLPQINPGMVTKEDLASIADILEKLENVIVDTFVNKRGVPEDIIRKLISSNEGTWLNGTQAKELGLIDVLDKPMYIKNEAGSFKTNYGSYSIKKYNLPEFQNFTLDKYRTEINSFKQLAERFTNE